MLLSRAIPPKGRETSIYGPNQISAAYHLMTAGNSVAASECEAFGYREIAPLILDISPISCTSTRALLVLYFFSTMFRA
jgi:hypothetical protein